MNGHSQKLLNLRRFLAMTIVVMVPPRIRGKSKRANKRKEESVMSTEFASAGLTAGQLNAIVKKLGGHDRALMFLRDELTVSEPVKPKLLELLGIVSVPASAKKFVAKKKFVINTGDDASVKISYLGDNFKNEFLGKTEKPFAGSELRQQKLMESSVDGPIIAEIGGEAKAETTLTEIFALMEKQGKGQAGALLNNGWWNIFYVRNAKGVLRAVYVGWGGGGWGVYAGSVEGPIRWYAGRQVFSRNS